MTPTINPTTTRDPITIPAIAPPLSPEDPFLTLNVALAYPELDTRAIPPTWPPFAVTDPPQGISVNLTLLALVPNIAYIENVPVQSRENVIAESISFEKVMIASREVALGDQVKVIGTVDSTY